MRGGGGEAGEPLRRRSVDYYLHFVRLVTPALRARRAPYAGGDHIPPRGLRCGNRSSWPKKCPCARVGGDATPGDPRRVVGRFEVPKLGALIIACFAATRSLLVSARETLLVLVSDFQIDIAELWNRISEIGDQEPVLAAP